MKNILIVDDEEDIRSLYESEFEVEGYQTSSVMSGREAIKYIDENSDLDLIILDIKMEDVDGLEVLENIPMSPNAEL